VAETIANNVRSKIVKEHLNNPAYYERMSALLEEIIADLRAKRVDYAEYLRRIALLAAQVQKGQGDDTPEELRASPGRRAIYNNLRDPGESLRTGTALEGEPEYRLDGDPKLALTLEIDATVKRVRPDEWRGHQARENVIKAALFPLLRQSVDEVERIFAIIKAHAEY